MKIIYPPNSCIRKNIEQIVFFRDQAIHLLMPELQGITSRIFQSGVLNFTAEFEKFTEVSLFNNAHTGMISLVGDFKSPPISVMKSTYGDIAKDIIKLATSLENLISENNDSQFAIPLNVKLVYQAKDADGKTITLTKADQGIEGLQKALILEKPVDREKSHPFLQNMAVKEINKRLEERYDKDKLDLHLVALKKSGTGKIDQFKLL